MNRSDHRQLHTDMISRELQSAVNLRPEPQRSVLDKFSKMQSMSSLPSLGLTDPAPNSNILELKVLQYPQSCRVSGKQDKDKTRPSKYPLDPAPVVEFLLHDGDVTKSYLHSPFWFCTAALESSERYHRPADGQSSMLSGCLVSSLHKVKLTDSREHGLFIFGDLNAKVPGDYRLRFTLYELRTSTNSTYVATMTSIESSPFTVYTGKRWPGQNESTQLSKHLCESGVKLRIRKETSKRKAQSQDWSADKKTALSSVPYARPPPGLMGPPMVSYPAPRRVNGEEIENRLSRDGLNLPRDGLGIRNHMDQEANGYLGGHQQLPRPPPISPMGPPSAFSQQSFSQSGPLAPQYRTANPGYLYQQQFSPDNVSTSPSFAPGSSNSTTGGYFPGSSSTTAAGYVPGSSSTSASGYSPSSSGNVASGYALGSSGNTTAGYTNGSINNTITGYPPGNNATSGFPPASTNNANPGYAAGSSYNGTSPYAAGSSNSNSANFLRQPQPSSPQHHRTSSSQEYAGITSYAQQRQPLQTRAADQYQDISRLNNRYMTTPSQSSTSYNSGLVQSDLGHSLNLTRNQAMGHPNPGQSLNVTRTEGLGPNDASQTLGLVRNDGLVRDPGWQDFQTTQRNAPRDPSISNDFDPYHTSR